MMNFWKPSRDQIRESQDKTVPDLIRDGLKIVFSGINPSLYSAAVGHHFARPGNRFWPTLHAAGFTPRLFSPFEDRLLLDLGYGVTNLVDRATASAAELLAEEFVEGGRSLAEKVSRSHPRIVAFLGIIAYRSAFGRPEAKVGLQAETISGSRLWVLPNPSGLNAHYQLSDLVKLFEELRREGELNSIRPQP
jgi:double-stranded uracil-DNA glycosylase